MPARATIPIYGNEPSLLETRRLILARSGFAVRATHKPNEAAQFVEDGAVDLTIVCHSVPDAEAKRLLAVAQTSHPTMKTVALIPARPTWIPQMADAVVSALDGPSALLASVRVALGPN